MTTPVAPVGASYAATDLQAADLSIFLQFKRGLHELPSVRGEDTVIPTAEGRHEMNRVNDVVRIELEGHVTADADALTNQEQVESFWVNAETLRTLFASDRAWAALNAVLPDGTIKSIQARPLNMIFTEVIGSLFATVSVELEGYGDWTTASS